MALLYLTTADNHFNPETDYKRWHDYDANQMGYYTAEYLDRVYEKNMELAGKNPFSVEIDEDIMEQSIDEIIEMNERIQNLPVGKSELPKIKYVKITSSRKR